MSPSHDAELDPRRKRARFRAWHRGIREMDLIMGRFADREMATLADADLDEFERLMDVPDQEILTWILGTADPPRDHDTPLLSRLREFRL